jgi:hypothetical protein
MFQPEINFEIARQHRHELLAEARSHRARKSASRKPAVGQRSRRRPFAWVTVQGWQPAH